MNRFCFVYNGSKPEFIEIEYSKYNTVKGINERRTKRACRDTYENIFQNSMQKNKHVL